MNHQKEDVCFLRFRTFVAVMLWNTWTTENTGIRPISLAKTLALNGDRFPEDMEKEKL